MRTVTSNHRGTLTNLTRNFDAGKSKLIFDNQHNGTKDNNDNKKLKKNKNTVMLDEREAAYRNEDASNSFTFMTVIVIIIGYIFTMYLVDHHHMLYTIALSTRAMLNAAGKCVVLGEAMQSFVHKQHDGVGKVKHRKGLRSRCAKFVYYNHGRFVC